MQIMHFVMVWFVAILRFHSFGGAIVNCPVWPPVGVVEIGTAWEFTKYLHISSLFDIVHYMLFCYYVYDLYPGQGYCQN